jgi:hypothetical protein
VDDYEQKYMEGQGAVLHRQKVQAPRWALPLVAWLPAVLALIPTISLLVSGAAPLAALAPLGGALIYGALMTGLLVTLAGGRIAVSEGELHVQIGPFGPRVPIEDIASCEVGASGVRSYGLGAQKLLDGTTIYKMLGDNAKAARITRRDGSKMVLVCPDAEAVVAAVRMAMERRALPRTRVAVPDEDAAADPSAETRARRA